MRRRVFWVQLILVLIIVVGIVWAFAGNRQEAEDAIPHKIGDLTLATSVTGPEALAQIEQLHGKGVGITGGYMAQYKGRGAEMMVWVGKTDTAATAQKLLALMTERIRAGNQTFTPPTEIYIERTTVYRTTGIGQQHYYYQKGAQVIWLAITSAEPELLVKAALGTIP